MFFEKNNEYYTHMEKQCIQASKQDTINLKSEVNDSKSDDIDIQPNYCPHYITNLTRKMVFRFVTYGNVLNRPTYTRGLLIYNSETIKMTEFQSNRCRYTFKVRSYMVQLKFSQKCFGDNGYIQSSRSILDTRCSCATIKICKHITASLLMLCDDDYEPPAIIPYINYYQNVYYYYSFYPIYYQ